MADDRLSEGALIERLRAADGEALADLAVRYRPQLYDLALRHLRCPEEAEEVVQDVLIKVCRRIRTFRGESALSTWIYRITFNHTMSRLRRKTLCAVPPWARGSGRASEGSGVERADLTPAPDEQLLRAELRQQVATAIRALPPAFRRVVVLRHLHELSIREVSRELRVNPSTVKSRLHRGRRMLRRALAALARGPRLDEFDTVVRQLGSGLPCSTGGPVPRERP